jgi:hypothetical protein
MLWWYSVSNGDAARASVCAMVKPCASGDDGKGARARGREGEADNAHVEDGEAAHDRKRDCMAVSVRKGNVKVIRSREGNSGPQYASLHALARPPAYVKKLTRRPYVSPRTQQQGRQHALI